MTLKERINDICDMTGFTEDVVRRIMEAECESLAQTLAKGEKATLLGRATFVTSKVSRAVSSEDNSGELQLASEIEVKVRPSKSLVTRVNQLVYEEKVDYSDEIKIPGIATLQIEGLT